MRLYPCHTLFRECPVQERHDLLPGTLLVGREGSPVPCAAGNALLHGPAHGLGGGAVLPIHVGELPLGAGRLGTALQVPEHIDDQNAGASRPGIAILVELHGIDGAQAPVVGLIAVVALVRDPQTVDVDIGFRLSGGPPEEDDRLPDGAGIIGGEAGLTLAAGDSLLYRPVDGTVEIVRGMYVLKAARRAGGYTGGRRQRRDDVRQLDVIAGQQHLKFGKEDGKETVRIKSGRKAFFLQTDSGTEISVFTKYKCSLAQNVQIKWR